MAKLPPIPPVDHPALAKELVREWVSDGLGIETQVFVVWFSYILGGWKALVSTTEPDGRYYEVTYNNLKHEAYVDTYKKTHNHAVKFVDQKSSRSTEEVRETVGFAAEDSSGIVGDDVCVDPFCKPCQDRKKSNEDKTIDECQCFYCRHQRACASRKEGCGFHFCNTCQNRKKSTPWWTMSGASRRPSS